MSFSGRVLPIAATSDSPSICRLNETVIGQEETFHSRAKIGDNRPINLRPCALHVSLKIHVLYNSAKNTPSAAS